MPIKWGKEFLRQRDELIASFDRRKGSVPFEGLSRAELDALKNQPFAAWLKTFLPEQFSVPDAPFHAEADRRMDTVGIPVGNCWFGGAGKTWRYVVAKGLYRICQGTYICKRPDGTFLALPSHEANDPTRADVVSRRRIALRVVGARNLKKAAEKTVIMRLALEHSRELRAAYGDRILPSKGEDEETDFTANGVRTVALGIGSDIRGAMQIGGPRVQEVDLDDIENNEIAASKESEDKIEDQIFLGWIARCEANGAEAIFSAQMNQYRSRHCQARRWAKAAAEKDEAGKPNCLFHRVALDDGEFHSNWPARYTDAACRRLAFQFGTARYNVEFRCREVSEDCKIDPDWFVDFRVDRVAPSELAKMRFVAALDPNHKAGETNDPSAWIVMAGYTGQRHKFVMHAWIKNCTSTERVRHQWEVEDAFPNAHIIMEDEALTETYGELYVRMCHDARRPTRRIKGIKHTGNKKDRILTDAGDIERGEWHVDPTEGHQGILLDQYSEIPKEKAHDDGPDAAEMASAELDLLLLGAGIGEIRRGLPRADYGALTGIPPRRVALPGSLDDRWDREHESAFDRMERVTGGLVF